VVKNTRRRIYSKKNLLLLLLLMMMMMMMMTPVGLQCNEGLLHLSTGLSVHD